MYLAHVPVQVAVDRVGVDGFPIAGGDTFKSLADLDRLRIHDDGVFAQAVDDFINLLPFFGGAVAHGVARVDHPGVRMGDELVEGLGRFPHGDDIVGNAHVASPILGKADLLVHPGEDFIEVMVSILEGAEKGIGHLGIFQLFLDGPFGVDEGDDQVGLDEVADDPLVLELPIDSVPFDGGGSTDDDVPLIVAEDLVADLFVLPLPGEFEHVIGGAQESFQRLLAGLGEVVDGVVDLDVTVVALPEGDDLADVFRIVHACDHAGDEGAHRGRM